ncbi:hypothetical protein AB0362_20325 [Rhodococcus sp. NPDC079359]|uniref:hypothetical protein n=1 Tax=unclassified Rhodococcus (in: high G+C Gram-positive bacteria) TaxID=192944 RepID=UPI000B2223E3|nr:MULTISPECIES: hypothetical protein [unclassified Rhodococcus (in: high G+C Gram-positive bacteria)]
MDIYSILVASVIGSAAVLSIAKPVLLAMTIIDITRALRNRTKGSPGQHPASARSAANF